MRKKANGASATKKMSDSSSILGAFPKKVFDMKRRISPYVMTSEIKEFEGESGESIHSRCCSTVAIQAKGGKRPLTLLWHSFPYHVLGDRLEAREYPAHRDEERDFFTAKGAEWKDYVRQSELKDDLFRSLDGHGAVWSPQTNAISPQGLVDSLIGYVKTKRPGQDISVAIFPGSNTLDPSDPDHVHALAAVKRLEEMFKTHKRQGAVKNVRTRGMSPDAKTIGSTKVYVSPGGRLFRDDVRKRIK